jgi:hypothetical protein
MESEKQKEVLYTKEWFQNRAINSLEKIDEGLWDYSDPLFQYESQGADVYESIQEEDTLYSQLVTKPEREYLQEIAPDIVSELPNGFEYIDLGPGTEHKEQFIFDSAKKQNKYFTYTPVDINDHFLEQSDSYALKQGVRTNPLRLSFEELPEKLSKSSTQCFVSLGLTFSNSHPEKILNLLKSIAGDEGYAFINAQIRERTDMEALLRAYSGDTYKAFDPKMQLLGIDPEKDILERETDDGIRVWYAIKNSNEILNSKGIKKGDKLLVFQSLRYSKETLEKEISEVFPKYTLYDTGKSFIGSLCRP